MGAGGDPGIDRRTAARGRQAPVCTLETSSHSRGETYRSIYTSHPTAGPAHPAERSLGRLLCFLLRSSHPLDQQRHRAGDWTHENARSHGERLQDLAGHADWLDAGRNEDPLKNVSGVGDPCASPIPKTRQPPMLQKLDNANIAII